jgi:hypothetical protein
MGPRIYPSQQNTNDNATGKIIITLDEYQTFATSDFISISNLTTGETERIIYLDVNGYYSSNIIIGNSYGISLRAQPFNQNYREILLSRRDYTTDDINGSNGIVDTYITGATGNTGTLTVLYFTGSTLNNSSYNFEYRVSAKSLPL